MIRETCGKFNVYIQTKKVQPNLVALFFCLFLSKLVRFVKTNKMMYRLYIPIVFLLIFLVWIFYKLIITKDLKENLNVIYLGLFFIGIWGVIYKFVLQ